jgi:hypothetical protein
VADCLVPNRVRHFLKKLEYRGGGKYFSFQRLGRAFRGANSKKVKMRRLPPAVSAHEGRSQKKALDKRAAKYIP